MKVCKGFPTTPILEHQFDPCHSSGHHSIRTLQNLDFALSRMVM